MAKSVEDQIQSMIDNYAEKTGKPLDAWLKIIAASKLAKHGDIVKMLKADHGMGHGFANLAAHRALASDAGSSDADDLVSAQYAGAKAGLKPVYDALIAIADSLGKDVELSPKKAYVSLRRTKQFGLIQPSTATRVDLGLNLKGVEPAGKLEASGSFNAMVTHRVKLASVTDVDKQVRAWMKAAYDLA